MENDLKREALRQYLHYFRIWFILIGVLAVACIGMVFVRNVRNLPRTNEEAPKERVFDYADVLTEKEEEDLRRYIAKMESRLQIDIVLVTINQPVEGEEAMEAYDLRSRDWEQNMQDIADDFWDENRFGYNQGFEGDGVLLLHNWYPGQNGEHLSTSGSVERAFSSRDIDEVLYAVDEYYATDPYRAYQAYVKEVGNRLDPSTPTQSPSLPFSWMTVIVLPIIAALCYGIIGSAQGKARNTVAVNAYVVGGKPDLKDKRDELVRKNVVTRKIESSQSSNRSGGSSGGHHTSRSGASHGGGSYRGGQSRSGGHHTSRSGASHGGGSHRH